MDDRFTELDVVVPFRSNDVFSAVTTLWRQYFERVAKLPMAIDRAIWICHSNPYWIAVKPGYRGESDENEAEFAIALRFSGLRELREEYAKVDYNSLGALYAEYYQWLRGAVLSTYESREVHSLKERTIRGVFGVYSTWADDIGGDDLSEADWIAGDDLKKPAV